MRASGILMHLSSLPSPYGIGTMGAAAQQFVDFLADAGQSVWQILPICPTSFGDSPYQSFSTFAGNPYLLDLDLLSADGLLLPSEYRSICWQSSPEQVDYGLLYQKRYPVLRKAAARFLQSPPADYAVFCQSNAFWLPDYALFMALKDAHGGKPWFEWEPALRHREASALALARQQFAGDVAFWQILQYLFFSQWQKLKAYANRRGISIIGDLPIYVAADSVDVWAMPDAFLLDAELRPTEVAGCPPDGFSATGQLWGNPLFNWSAMEQDGFSWWIRRIGHVCKIYDTVRIDHFRGFESFYAIPYGSVDACGGHWCKGPGIALFQAVNRALGPQNILAEDLGFLTEEVHELLRESGYPGMKVLEFAFDSRDDSDYLPHTYPRHCVVYTGTHDNEPVAGWFETAPKADVDHATRYLRLNTAEGLVWGMLCGAWSSVADLSIVQAQDILMLGHSARMNTPSTLGGNWRWRALPTAFTPELAQKLRATMALYGRLGRQKKTAL